MSYIVTYIIPFLDAPLADPLKGLSIAVLFLVLGILYVNSNLIHTNPMLNLGGYHIFEVETTDGHRTAIITTRAFLPLGSELSVVPLGDYVVLEKRT